MSNNTKRDQLITKYKIIKSKWDNDEDLKQILPETYQSICNKLEGLKADAEYTITDKTQELKNMIAYVGGQIPSVNFKCVNGEYILINRNNCITYKQAQEVAKEFK
jgi:hypothetical protein